MLRRRTAKPKPASPEPKDPSTVADAGSDGRGSSAATAETPAEVEPSGILEEDVRNEESQMPGPRRQSLAGRTASCPSTESRTDFRSGSTRGTGPATGTADTAKPDPVERVVIESP